MAHIPCQHILVTWSQERPSPFILKMTHGSCGLLWMWCGQRAVRCLTGCCTSRRREEKATPKKTVKFWVQLASSQALHWKQQGGEVAQWTMWISADRLAAFHLCGPWSWSMGCGLTFLAIAEEWVRDFSWFGAAWGYWKLDTSVGSTAYWSAVTPSIKQHRDSYVEHSILSSLIVIMINVMCPVTNDRHCRTLWSHACLYGSPWCMQSNWPQITWQLRSHLKSHTLLPSGDSMHDALCCLISAA